MPIPPSGPITMSMINVELARPATQVINLNEAAVRALAEVPAGAISLSNFYGKSSVVNKGFFLGGGTINPLGAVDYFSSSRSIAWSTETISAISSLPATRSGSAVMRDTSDLILISGFPRPSVPTTTALTNTLRFNFSSETYALTSIGSGTANAPQNAAVCSPTNGYVAGLGGNFPGGGVIPGAIITRYNFSTNTLAGLGSQNVPFTTQQTIFSRGGITNPAATFGFFAGGFTPMPGPAQVPIRRTQMNKFPFSTEVSSFIGDYAAPTRANWSRATTTNIAHFVNGDNPGTVSGSVTLNFATNAQGTGATPGPRFGMGCAQSNTFAYFKGGQVPTPLGRNVLNYMKLTFSSNTYSIGASFPGSEGAIGSMSGQPTTITP